MRRAVLIACVLASACTPEIVTDSYYCGPERLCPEDQTCDGVTNICVGDGFAMEFACSSTESEPNDTFATAESIGDIDCTMRLEGTGCVRGDSDAQDYFGFTVPASCTPRKIAAQASYPVAFEPIVIEVVDGAGAVLAASEPCPSVGEEDIGTTSACVEAPVTPGTTYALRLAGSGSENCAGACAFNRYGLIIQLLAQ